MDVAEKLKDYFNNLDSKLRIRIKEPFPEYLEECEEYNEAYIYSAFFDKKNGSTSIVEVFYNVKENNFSINLSDKGFGSIDKVINALDGFFKGVLKE